MLLYYGEPGPFGLAQEIYFDFLPPGNGEAGQYVESGIWEITLKAAETVDGRYDLWLPSGGVLNRSTRFLRPVRGNHTDDPPPPPCARSLWAFMTIPP